ncbi:T9SS type A sorting domain-containing protein [Reichenbachiella carrageenanivorans]|uniref:T9SS type A sorting domain-containing protein n=1 Tax=Reichenbachiella carrageenanivorans TaxID=2979869 RepID=A0ABY6D4B7_9BACT|nr:T9SS type A sorting domain-containing protein [Reichenbachiella carrageenanivorans]UXX81002.1 T9SS type A sorting domain-containing protein [Reichenbachiella carrageenanivorans]
MSLYSTQAQVSQLGLGFGGSLMDYHIDQNETIWVGVDVSGLYKSDDRGASWQRMNNQIVSEHISEIFVHPDDANLIILGTRGALLRSTDRGETWTDIRAGFPAHKSSGAPSLAIVSIVVDPHNADILYAAQGDRREAAKGSMANSESLYGRGAIYKSTDRGLTWVNLRSSYGNNIPGSANIFALAASNQVEGVLFAASSRGLFKSTDGGKKFSYVYGLPHDRVTSVAIAPGNNNKVYVTLDYEDANGYGVYKSTDFGSTWAAANNGIPQAYEGGNLQPYHLIIDWSDNDVVYMASAEAGCIFKTINGGASWTNAYRGRVEDQGWSSYGTKYLKVYGFAMSPVDNKFLIAGEHWSHKTSDGADSWYNVYSTNSSPYQNNGADFTVSDYVVPSPITQNLVLMGQYDNGLYRSTNAGTTWENKSSEMRKNGVSTYLTAVTDIAYAVNGDIYVAIDMSYYVANGGGFVIKKSTNGGVSWSTVLNAKKGSGSEFYNWGIYHGLETHPTDGDIVYVTSYDPGGHMTIKSEDAGATWNKIGQQPDNRLIRQLEIDESDPDIMYAVAGTANEKEGRLYKSIDAGINWTTVMSSGDYRDYRDLAIDPKDNETLYLAATPNGGVGGVYKSTDGGATWTTLVTASVGTKSDRLNAEIQANGNFFGATSVSVHPDDSDILLATFGAATGQWFGDYRPGYGLAISKDAGVSWDLVGRNIIKYGRLYHIEFDPLDHNVIYTGSGGSGGFKIHLDELIDTDNALGALIDQLRLDETAVDIAYLTGLGITGLQASKVSNYQTDLLDQVDEIYMMSQVQFIVNEANLADVTALEQLQQYLADDQAQLITEELLVASGITNVYSELFFEYQWALAVLDGQATQDDIQAKVNEANRTGSLGLINIYLEREDISFADAFLQELALSNVRETALLDYKAALAKADLPITNAQIQMLVDQINEELGGEESEVTAVEEMIQVNIYPNPTAGELRVEWNGKHTVVTLEVSDLAGKPIMILNEKNQNAISVFDVSQLRPGLYIIRIADGFATHTLRLVKK